MWSDAARAAALEARKLHGKGRLAFSKSRYKEHHNSQKGQKSWLTKAGEAVGIRKLTPAETKAMAATMRKRGMDIAGNKLGSLRAKAYAAKYGKKRK